MAIGTGQVTMSELATEIAVGSANFSLGDRSRRLWKNGPSDYASYKEVRNNGSNCQFSTVLTAQGTFLQNSTDPWAYITANGMNAKPCGMGEWKGYDHEIKSTIGRFRVNTDENSQWNGNSYPDATNPSPLDDVVAHIGAFHARSSNTFPAGSTNAATGIALWAEKAYGVVYIKMDDIAGGNWNNGSASSVATNVQQLGPNLGAGQTTSADAQATTFATTTLMTISGATRITGCEVTLESGLPTDSSGVQPSDPDPPYGSYSGIKTTTIDHDSSVTTGATSTTNFGSTKIGYDLCVGGNYYTGLGGNPDHGHVEAVFGVEFNFYATNNLQSLVGHPDYAVGQLEILNSNPAGPTGTNGVDGNKPFRSHKITVYVSLFSMGEHTFTG